MKCSFSEIFPLSSEKAVNRPRRSEEAEWDDDTEGGWLRKGRNGCAVMLEGYVEVTESDKGSEDGGDVMGRTKSLTDEDLEELKGCLDLGFGFCYEDIPALCNTLPALELCYSMSQKFLDEKMHQQRQMQTVEGAGEAGHDCVVELAPSYASSVTANWWISSPGDNPDDVKARLKYWAQAVACTVRLCS